MGLRNFSKAYGLAGARVGYAFGPRKLIEAINKVAIPFSVNSLAQAGALAALDAKEELKERIDEAVIARERIAKAFADWGAIASEARTRVAPRSRASTSTARTRRQIRRSWRTHPRLPRRRASFPPQRKKKPMSAEGF